jgi:predicted  nucleic acid-binding Zn-ribbon protein
MNTTTVFLILGAIGGFGGFAALLTALFSRKKLNRESDLFAVRAAESLTSMAMRQLGQLERDILALKTRVDDYRVQLESALVREKKLEGRVTLLQTRVGKLEEYIKSHGLAVPVE